jgi:hypothetical protein
MFEPRETGSKNFLDLKKAGAIQRGVFAGEVFKFKQHWSQTQKKGTICPGFEKCETCAKVTDEMSDEEKKKYWPSFRFRVNFIINENGAYTAKIFEQGATVYDTIVPLGQDYDLRKHLFKITRHGSGKDTTYSIVPVPNGQLDAEKLKQISEVTLQSLDGKSDKKDAAPADDLDALLGEADEPTF